MRILFGVAAIVLAACVGPRLDADSTNGRSSTSAGVALSCAPPETPSFCHDAAQRYGACQIETIPAIGTRCPTGKLLTMRASASGGDYFFPVYTQYLQVDDAPYLKVGTNWTSSKLAADLSYEFHRKIFPGRGGNYIQEGWLPLSTFFTQLIESSSDTICLTLRASYPFAGSVRRCADDTQQNNLRPADGVMNWEDSKERSAKLLASNYDLNVRNADHFEGRQPRSFDAINKDGQWYFVLKYEGRRLERPWWTYTVVLPVTGLELGTVTKSLRER